MYYKNQNTIESYEIIELKLSKKEPSASEEISLNTFSQKYNVVYKFKTKESDLAFELFEYKLNDRKW